MKIPSSSEKPKNLLDLVTNGSEAVKVSTKSSSNSVNQNNDRHVSASDVYNEKATNIKLGLAKYLSEELDPKKVTEARQAKIASLKAQIDNGTYLSSINSDDLAKKILEESQLENLIVGKAANNE